MFNGKTLIFAPHMDDEVLGCGGLLADPYGNKHVHFLCAEHPTVGLASQIECEQIAEYNGHSISYDHFPVNWLHLEPLPKLIATLEALITRQRPDTALLPFPDYNQDHRTVYQAALTALRPHDENFYVKNVLCYEMPCTHQGGNMPAFRPDVYLPIEIGAKVALYEMYVSQVRAHRSCDAVRHLAGLRGMQSNRQFAEAFQVVRITL
jgi:LmbE family N-acetylglucosaminyl deacetylase